MLIRHIPGLTIIDYYLYQILQGAEDKVVPPSQAEDMKKVIEEHGGHVEYELYQGEGHGWRRSETIVAALERELGFYRSVLGLA